MQNNRVSRVFFLNVTRQCNVDCPRCYLSEEVRAKKELVKSDDVKKALSDPYFSNDNVDVTVVFEGGEVTLIGEPALRDLIAVVQEVKPGADMTMVTNMFSLPDWLIRIAHEHFSSEFETTYAIDNKFSLKGSSGAYQKRFIRNCQKAIQAGISLVVNIELNKETVEAGPSALMSVIEETGVKVWEFDHSIYFDKFLSNPLFNLYGAPLFTPTTSYDDYSNFIIQMAKSYGDELQEKGIIVGALQHGMYTGDAVFFNIKNTQNMFTLNADGTCTTNVMFSDIPQMFIGNIKNETVTDMMASQVRRKLLQWENSQRTKPCLDCEFYMACGGGSSYLPVKDPAGTEECAGGKKLFKFMRSEYMGSYRLNNN